MTIHEHRYRGTSPFLDREIDRRTFFGRDRELRSLESLVLSEDLVVLFARSGMGKSSLLNAGLVHRLRRRGYLPLTTRVDDFKRGPVASVIERARDVAAEAQVEILTAKAPETLRGFFHDAEFWSPDDELLRPVLILDQFEELFTLHEPAARREFITEFASLVQAVARKQSGRRLKIILSLREEFLADLEELAAQVPGILGNRFRLRPLTREGARQAIVEPARLRDTTFETAEFVYREEAVDAILEFLAKTRRGSRFVMKDAIEPVQLQLICQHLEALILDRQREDSGPSEVLGHDVNDEDRMRQVLRDFYRATLDKVGNRKARKAVHILCEERLISASGRRLNRSEEEIVQTEKIPLETLHLLVDERLLRSEPRLGGTFYELSHDTLVEPILETRAGYRRRKRVQQCWLAGAVLMVIGVALAILRSNELAAQEIRLAEANDLAAVERLLRVAPAWPRGHNDTVELATTKQEALLANEGWTAEANTLLERIADIHRPALEQWEAEQRNAETDSTPPDDRLPVQPKPDRIEQLDKLVVQVAALEEWLPRIDERRATLEETPFELWQRWKADADNIGELIAGAPIWPRGENDPADEAREWDARCAGLLARMDGYSALADRLPESDRRKRIRTLLASRGQLQRRQVAYDRAPWQHLEADDRRATPLVERAAILAYSGPDVAADLLSEVKEIVGRMAAYAEIVAVLPPEDHLDFALAGLATSPTLLDELEATRGDWLQAGIPAQVGLVPIGRDPRSGRWEFWLPISGTRPERDDEGRLVMTPASGLVFVHIPAGTFQMGSKAGGANEKPVHEVGLDGYFLSKFELTRAQWARLNVAGAEREAKPEAAEATAGDGLLPVRVSWTDAERHLRRWHLQLPSEAQWEYACRAGTVTPWSIPEDAKLQDYAWFTEQGTGEPVPGGRQVQPIGQKRPNPWGLHDVHGNAWEWCLDGYYERFYQHREATSRNPLAPFRRTSSRVHRGGAVTYDASALRSAVRHPNAARALIGVRPLFALNDATPSIWERLSPRLLASAKRVQPVQREQLQRLLTRRQDLERTLGELQAMVPAIKDAAEVWSEIGIPPQVGLVPLGRDAKSKLWEFWVPRTGTRPDWVDDQVVPSDDMGVVLVLVPGGKFLMGSQNTDPEQPNYVLDTAPYEVHPVELSHFFLSKFEMTQHQWARLTGQKRKPGGPELQPIDGVSWSDGVKILARGGLLLPTESQWEYACRAGTTGKFWFDASLATERFAPEDARAPRAIGTNSPNPFGLYDVHGNVHEWCRDWFAPYGERNAPRPGDGLRPAQGSRRVTRGGSFRHGGRVHRAATYRGNTPPTLRERGHGFRPARPVVDAVPNALLTSDAVLREVKDLMASARRFWAGASDLTKVDAWSERAAGVSARIERLLDLATTVPAGPFAQEIRALGAEREPLRRWRELVPEIAAAVPLWQAARRDVLADRRFAGFELDPIAELLPLGKNATSGLWEFWAPNTGSKPAWSPRPLPSAPEGSSANVVLAPESALVFVLVPGGKFQMGRSDDASNPSAGVSIGEPRHGVTVAPFLASKFEVTQAQWLRNLGESASQRDPRRGGYGRVPRRRQASNPTAPMANVQWSECFRFCERLGFSLPSESQWEYACRGGSEAPFSFANWNDETTAKNYVRFGSRENGSVGARQPNTFGLHDVHGSVWEWCLDRWNPTFEGAPADGSPWWDGDARMRVHRGGGYRNPLAECRADARAGNDGERASFPDVGLRPIMDPRRTRRMLGADTGFVAGEPVRELGRGYPVRHSDPDPWYGKGEPVDRVLVGVSVTHGMFVDSIQPIYRALSRDGLGKEFRGSRVGGFGGGGPDVVQAPPGWVVTGIECHFQSEIHRMRLVYSRWGDLQVGERATRRSEWIGERESGRLHELACGPGEFVAGITGTSMPSRGGWLLSLAIAKGRKKP